MSISSSWRRRKDLTSEGSMVASSRSKSSISSAPSASLLCCYSMVRSTLFLLAWAAPSSSSCSASEASEPDALSEVADDDLVSTVRRAYCLALKMVLDLIQTRTWAWILHHSDHWLLTWGACGVLSAWPWLNCGGPPHLHPIEPLTASRIPRSPNLVPQPYLHLHLSQLFNLTWSSWSYP